MADRATAVNHPTHSTEQSFVEQYGVFRSLFRTGVGTEPIAELQHGFVRTLRTA